MQLHSKSKQILKSAFLVTIFSIFTRGISFIFKIYFSRVLGAEAMGLYQICLSVFYLFVAFTSSGLVTVLSRRVAEVRALNPLDRGLSLLSASLMVTIILSSFMVFILYFLRNHINFLFSDERAKPLFLIMLPALITTSIYGIVRGWFWGNKDFLSFSITELLEEIFRVLFSVLFVSGLFGAVLGERGIVLAFVVSDIMVAIVLVILFFIKGGRLRKPSLFKPLLMPSLPLTGMRIFAGLLGTTIAILLPIRLMAGGFSTAEATASFGRIAGMANPLLFAPNAIITSLSIVLIPEMSENGIKKQNLMLSRHIEGGISFSLVISGAFLILFAAFGSDLTRLLFADNKSGEYLQVASYLLLIMPICQITSSALNSIGLEKEAFKSYLCSSLFLIASIYFTAPVVGIYSVIIANFISMIVNSIMNLYFLNKRIPLKFDFFKPLAYITIFSIPWIMFAKNLRQIANNLPSLITVLLSGLIITILYIVFLYLLGLLNIGGFLKFKNFSTGKHKQNAT
ncbi:MAG: oligosaccharide flippase family protein [Christensenellaceae bacterium]|jgi:stage V sporulation protein B|nr:oligosaccharide flippase family protein [Christensenellaceae bacterium]